ncbi:hypothetical protein CHH28_10960 [Bacterioplanes sanyensis]|uniref:Uncharacterized protein n=2 Tax=Bacterioplanes sanyensis TaxID=1249553 RepID=A0A222FJE2_9GAMM|nr:hypothetical protein CHH28_10960 [Bacterioplanes sanyensis]
MPSVALQPLSELSMAQVTGQSGLTVETTINHAQGDVLTAAEFRFTEADRTGDGQDEYLALENILVRATQDDGNGGRVGDSFVTTLDVSANGDLIIRTSDMDFLTLQTGKVVMGGRALFESVAINDWNFAGNSFIETTVLNETDGARIRYRTVMEDGSGLGFAFSEDGVTFTSDVLFKPASGNSAFVSEVFLSGGLDGVKLEFGETQGSFEINNITLRNANGDNLFGSNDFGDVGYGDIDVVSGYMTIQANDAAGAEGIRGSIASNVTIGTAFYRTGDQRINFRNAAINTNGDINYQLDFLNNGFATGLEGVIDGVSDVDFVVGALTLSNGDGSDESVSMGAYGIENLNFNGGSLEVGLYTLGGQGSQGLRLDSNLSGKTSFDLTIKDSPIDDPFNSSAPALTAEVVMQNVSLSQTVDQTEKGLHIGIVDASLDASVNSIQLGTGANYQGQTGRVVINNLSMQPGSYLRVQPLQ